MSDDNYWKERYSEFWEQGLAKEELVKAILERECQCVCEYHGLGAGSSEYINGHPSNHQKGSSDLKVQGKSILIEVTGSNKPLAADEPLWIRPDKIKAASSDRNFDHWAVFVYRGISGEMKLVALHINDAFLHALKTGKFLVTNPTIRGTRETYINIPSNSVFLSSLSVLMDAVRFG